MKRLCMALFCFALVGLQASAQETILKTDKDKLSYSIGANLGKGLKDQKIDVDPDMLARGLKDAFTNGKLQLTEDQIKEVLGSFQKGMVAKQQSETAALSEKNKKEGTAFLAANKAKAGVQTLPDGLQYKVIKPGNGPKPKTTDTVVANYRGTFIDGKEFDSSYTRGKPAEFQVDGVIKGWTEALQLMPVGSKWQIFIPSDLAYGERGAGGVIGPNSTLVFEVELVSIKPPGSKPTPQ